MSEITKYEIDMLDVKAADAFLIHAFVNKGNREEEYVVLVDAGNEGDGKKILKHINKYYTQKYVDLAICTHCDSDHYGGFKELIEEHKKTTSDFKINRFWVHDPYQHVNVEDVKYIRNDQTLKERLNAAYAFNDGSNLLEKIDDAKIAREEPFDDTQYSPLNIFVLGPDRDYYESLIPDFRVDLDFKDKQPDDVYEGLFSYIYDSEDKFYSHTLENANDDPSKVNQSSVIFAFAPDKNVYLFTGDAGREALMKVIDEDPNGVLRNVRWMKVPHHGSKHNLNNEIISYFHPKVSYISTEDYGKYANICTVNALKKVGKVFSTHVNGSMQSQHNTPDREGYSPAKDI